MTLQGFIHMKWNNRGSALVLTLLFILLLTTMSTGLFLYANKQSLYADDTYTSLAAGYVSEAGLERGKSLLARRDLALDKTGDREIEEDDFPVIFDESSDIGRYDRNPVNGEIIRDNKQGVGTYSLRIDGAFPEQIEMKFQLVRHVLPFEQARIVYPHGVTIDDIKPLLPFKDMRIRLRQGIEMINDYQLDITKTAIIDYQLAHQTIYQPITLFNYMNPYSEAHFFLDMMVTRIDMDHDYKQYDRWGNRLVIFPHEDLPVSGVGGCPECRDAHIEAEELKDESALAFKIPVGHENSVYLLQVDNPELSPNLEIDIFYYDGLQNRRQTIIPQSSWSAGRTQAYALLDFSGACSAWRKNQLHDLADNLTGDDWMIIEMDGNAPTGMYLRIVRGVNDQLNLGYRARTENMYSTCQEDMSGNPDPDSVSCCWYPDWPECVNLGSNNYQPALELDSALVPPYNTREKTYAVTPLNEMLMELGRDNRIRIDEMYTITSTGNVEKASENRQLVVAPVSYMDYARFTESRIRIGGNSVFSGKVYAQGRIELAGTCTFFGDVYTSQGIVDDELATLCGDVDLHTYVPVQTLPSASLITELTTKANQGGWHYTGSTPLYLYLGNYDYLPDPGPRSGFHFIESGGIVIAEYLPPQSVNFPMGDRPYRSTYVPDDAPTVNLLNNPERDFNGLIVVDGDVHVWGKLHGRSLTILAKGDIYIEREIIMGTDKIASSTPDLSRGQGQPVHLGLIAAYSQGGNLRGDIILSENCPRIMQVQAALMCFGTMKMEDTDYEHPSDAGDIDLDNSHLHHYKYYNPIAGRYEWAYKTSGLLAGEQPALRTPIGPFDINNDGRLSLPPYPEGDCGENFNQLDPAQIDLGIWNESDLTMQHEVWYVGIIGPIIVANSNRNLGHYEARSAVGNNGGYENPGITRCFRYDPSIRITPPPLFPLPNRSLKILEVTDAVVELP